MIFPAATLDAQLLRFWRGDRILRIEQTARRRIGSTAFSTIRIPRQDRPDIEEAIADDLAASLANAHRNEWDEVRHPSLERHRSHARPQTARPEATPSAGMAVPVVSSTFTFRGGELQ